MERGPVVELGSRDGNEGVRTAEGNMPRGITNVCKHHGPGWGRHRWQDGGEVFGRVEGDDAMLTGHQRMRKEAGEGLVLPSRYEAQRAGRRIGRKDG